MPVQRTDRRHAAPDDHPGPLPLFNWPMALTRTRRTAAVLAAALVVSGCGVFGGDSGGGARDVGEAFLADWSAARFGEAAARTTDKATAATTLNKFQDTLRPDARIMAATGLSGNCDSADGCKLDFDVDLALNALGSWTYESALRLVPAGTGAPAGVKWQVRWEPSILHPELTTATWLSRTRELPGRAPILDRDGLPLVNQQPVVRVGVEAGKVPDGAIEKLAELTKVNVDGLLIRVNKADDAQFVEAVVLRQPDYAALKSQLDEIQGVIARPDALTLAPTRQFAREVLGAVGNATAEALVNAGPTASSADSVGLFGLQSLYQKQLAGRPGGRVQLINASTTSPLKTLVEFTGAPGTAVHTTLDLGIQSAAEQALRLTEENSSLVAIDTATGNVLAVANGPVDKAGEDRALNGQYAPGSTFKILSTLALLRGGMTTSEEIGCPTTVNVEGKSFHNYDGLGNLGRVPLSTNFALSCNTAFVRRVSDLKTDALTDVAASLGIGDDWDLLLNAFSGDVPPAVDRVELAADGIGQGRVLMSPLSMAMVASAVASGTPRYPRLILDGPPPEQAPAPGEPGAPSSVPSGSPGVTPAPFTAVADDRPALDPLPEAETLRQLMYLTVNNGTAKILDLPGPQVGAKTGTAEYGSETEPGKHAWIVGFVGTIAFAVIVERGESGSKTAGPIAKSFLRAIL